MTEEEFYREPPDPEKWYQGDIIRDVPHLSLVQPMYVFRFQDRHGGGKKVLYFEYDLDKPPHGQSASPNDGFRLHTENGDAVTARAQLALGMLISEDCEIDKKIRKKYLLVAPVRPLDAVPKEEYKEYIRTGQEDRAFYLPAGPSIQEAYVDLRRVTSISSDLLSLERRIACLSESLREDFQFQLIQFMTGRRLRPQ